MLRITDPTPADGREVVWQAAATARMNAIYYRKRIARFETIDQWLRIGAAILASGGVTAALKLPGVPWLPVAVGFAAAVIGVVSPILSYPERIKTSAVLLPQYVKAQQRLVKLYRAGKHDLGDIDVSAALDDLDRIEIVEADKERTVDPKLLDEAWKQVTEEIGASQNRAAA